MSIFENFPYTNFHELNLDYILKRVKELEGEVADLTALLESGPVVDVKANVGGSWVSQKDGSGNVNLPAGTHSTIGGLKFESTSDTEEPYIALSNGGGWEKVPALDASDKIDASAIPDTTVIAGTYGTDVYPSQNTKNEIFGLEVGSDGRILHIYQNPVQFVRSDTVVIAAGAYSAYVMFDNINYPWNNTDDWITVTPYEYYTNAKGVLNMKPLIYGTDYEYVLTTGMVTVNLLAAKANPVYVVVAGSYGRSAH